MGRGQQLDTGSTPSMISCSETSTRSINLGTVTVGDHSIKQSMTLTEDCSSLQTSIEWSLDDPDMAFAFSWSDPRTVNFRVSTSTVGQWEAQFLGDESNQDLLIQPIQLFATTVEKDSD